VEANAGHFGLRVGLRQLAFGLRVGLRCVTLPCDLLSLDSCSLSFLAVRRSGRR
jgi:hypothetical protein